MATVFVLGLVCAIITGICMVLELKWSINNVMELMNCNVFMRALKIPLIPFCFLPLIWDVGTTVLLINVMGMTGGMLGMTTTMVISSFVAIFLFYCRRKFQWRWA